jgi:hypothetical protein
MKTGTNKKSLCAFFWTDTLRRIGKLYKLEPSTKRNLGFSALLAAALVSHNANAGPVVVGSINPDTRQVTIFQDLLVKKFQDGTPIHNIYGRFFDTSKEFIMVRAGKSADGGCQTDAFRLVRITGNRLAIADDKLNRPWDGVGTVITIKKCFSGSCSGSCQVLGNPDTPDPYDYICHCSSASGPCENTMNALHTLDDIVWQEPVP